MIWLLLACAGSPEVPPADTEPGLPEVQGAEITAAWSPEQVQAELQAAVDQGLPGSADLIGHYLGLIALGDARCPGEGGQISGEHLWGCTADSGVWYAGVTELIEEGEVADGCWQGGRVLIGDVTIVDASQRTFALGGHVVESSGWDEDEQDWQYVSQISGSMRYEGAEDAFQEPVSGLLDTRLTGVVEGQRRGDFSGSVTSWGRSLELRGLRVEEAGACGVAWSGELRIREPGGQWHALTLEDACDGCGGLRALGSEEEVEICVQPQALLDQLLGRAEAACPR